MCHLYASELLNTKRLGQDEASGVDEHSKLTDAAATTSAHELHVNTEVNTSSSCRQAPTNDNVADVPQTKRLVGIATVFVKSHDSGDSTKTQQHKQQQLSSSLRHHQSSSTESQSVTNDVLLPNVTSPDGVTLPDGYARIVKYLPSAVSEHDEERLLRTSQELECCLFYIAELTSAEARNKLKRTDIGTFLLRDSSHTNYLYALTVKTCRGVTSIRVRYNQEGFQLDTSVQQVQLMPAFNTVLHLVCYYVCQCQRTVHSSHSRPSSGGGIYLDRSGKKDVPVLLKTPYQGRVTSLKHLCRLRVNKQLDGRSFQQLALSSTLKQFMQQYEFQF